MIPPNLPEVFSIPRAGFSGSTSIIRGFEFPLQKGRNGTAERATSLVEGTFDLSIRELRNQIIEFCRAGRAVKIDGLGTWTPNLKMDGSFDIQYRADNALVNGLNMPGVFNGEIVNAKNIGKSGDELVAMWNEVFPKDQVVL